VKLKRIRRHADTRPQESGRASRLLQTRYRQHWLQRVPRIPSDLCECGLSAWIESAVGSGGSITRVPSRSSNGTEADRVLNGM
jgi:hypothetical protein